MFGVLTWRSVPVLPVEIMLLPMWSPFHLNKISYWARTTIVPLMVLAVKKPRARNPKGIGIDELFLEDPRAIGPTAKAAHQSWSWFLLFRSLDAILRMIEPLFPKGLRQRAIDTALAFVEERLNGEDGLGAIYPPMANVVMMYDVLGKGEDFPPRAITRRGIEKLLVIGDHEAYCQPCVSPIWDTTLACHAMMEAGDEAALSSVKQGLDWLLPKQVLDLKGDWAVKRPDVRPGGWAFQYNNAHYPDLDDTAVVVMSMDRLQRMKGGHQYDAAIARGREWIEGMQSDDGGWAAFDVNNVEYYLNNIPFSDHGALLDPPTEDVTARCISMLAQLGETAQNPQIAAGIDYLRRTQLADGSWYGRWGMNYIYGTWSVLCALNIIGIGDQDPMMRKAVDWLVAIQNQDGGWGEDAVSYRLDYRGLETAPSTASQTAWALLALMAAGKAENPAVARGVEYLIATQAEKGLWDEARYTATGFPRVFYLRYHGYPKFFPLWALARYRNLKNTNSRVAGVGM
jgi:squalene-hopene/tetraprenyl-beta-curcumene cyclase